MKNVIVKTVAAVGIVAGLATGTAAAARAAQASSQSIVHPYAGPFYLPNPGNNVDVPTWFLTLATICAENMGDSSGEADLTGRLGGQATLLPGLGGTRCEWWWRAGVPVNIANGGTSPLMVWST